VSYLYADDLQAAVFRRLAGDAGLAALIGEAIHDGPPEAAAAGAAEYVTLGEERVRDAGSKTSFGAVHDFDVIVHSARDGFSRAKAIAARICECLVGAELDLERGRVVDVRFLRARADRGPSPVKRRVSLRFRAVTDGD
jgi:hypothetical protein